MLHSLRLRLLLSLMLVVVVAVGMVSLSGLVTTRVFRNYFQNRLTRDHVAVARLLEDAGHGGDLPYLQLRAEELSRTMGSQIILLNPNGDVLVDSEGALIGKTLALPSGQPAAPATGEPPLIFVVSGHAGPAPGTDEPTRPGNGNVVTIAPALIGGRERRAEPPLFGSLQRGFLLAAGASGTVAVVLGVLLSRRIFGPIESLTAATRRMETGDLSQRVAVRSKDEVGELAHAFNAMADSLGRLEKLRRTMVADIAHELRTPLSNIRGYLEAVRDNVLEPNSGVINSLYEEAMLLTRLVDDLQDLALAEAGQIRLSRQPVALGEIVEKTLAVLQPQLAGKEVAMKVDVPASLPSIYVDSERIGQVLRNLLTNAAQHTPPGGRIAISARAYGPDVEVSVSDSGAGITPENLPFVFERFYRADPSRARTTGGAGLGLAIVKQLVEAHGGHVGVHCEAGSGATFTFTLPAAGAA